MPRKKDPHPNEKLQIAVSILKSKYGLFQSDIADAIGVDATPFSKALRGVNRYTGTSYVQRVEGLLIAYLDEEERRREGHHQNLLKMEENERAQAEQRQRVHNIICNATSPKNDPGVPTYTVDHQFECRACKHQQGANSSLKCRVCGEPYNLTLDRSASAKVWGYIKCKVKVGSSFWSWEVLLHALL